MYNPPVFAPFEKTGSLLADEGALLDALRALADPRPVTFLANAAALLGWYLDDVNWVGFYLWSDEEDALVLGPFQGLPACVRIPRGRGVCGAAAESGEVTVVDDVALFPGHIACDSASRSELVAPMVRGGRLLGVLDVDSPSPGRFSRDDAASMGRIASFLAAQTAVGNGFP